MNNRTNLNLFLKIKKDDEKEYNWHRFDIDVNFDPNKVSIEKARILAGMPKGEIPKFDEEWVLK